MGLAQPREWSKDKSELGKKDIFFPLLLFNQEQETQLVCIAVSGCGGAARRRGGGWLPAAVSRGVQLVSVREQVTAARLCPCQVREPRILISHQVITAHFEWSHFK